MGLQLVGREHDLVKTQLPRLTPAEPAPTDYVIVFEQQLPAFVAIPAVADVADIDPES